VSVQDWIKGTLTVHDDDKNNRFLVKIGRLTFPVPYDCLLAETKRMLIDPEGNGDGTSFTYADDGLDIVMAGKSEAELRRDAEQKIVDDARAEMGKTLTVKRAIIEKGYGPKT
jgi:hypothetical protein